MLSTLTRKENTRIYDPANINSTVTGNQTLNGRILSGSLRRKT